METFTDKIQNIMTLRTFQTLVWFRTASRSLLL